MFTALILWCFVHLLPLVSGQGSTCVSNPGIRKQLTLMFDDLDTTNQSVIPAPLTYNWLAFNPSWEVVHSGSALPFTPVSLPNALVSPPNFTNATLKFSSTSSCESFDLLSLYIIGCWANPRNFTTTEACMVKFTGTQINGSSVTWERPVRKTQMELISFPRSRGFLNITTMTITSRNEFGNRTSGRLGVDNLVIARQDGKISCPRNAV